MISYNGQIYWNREDAISALGIRKVMDIEEAIMCNTAYFEMRNNPLSMFYEPRDYLSGPLSIDKIIRGFE